MKAKGITLIELVIVMAIAGILASIAWPSYQESLRKGYRKEAAAMLLEGAQAQEARILARENYTTNLLLLFNSARHTDVNDDTTPVIAPTPSGQHRITVVADADAATYTLTATPVNADTLCGAMTYNSTGVKTEGGTAADIDTCW